MNAQKNFPFEIEDVEPETNEKLLQYFKGKWIYM